MDEPLWYFSTASHAAHVPGSDVSTAASQAGPFTVPVFAVKTLRLREDVSFPRPYDKSPQN